MSLVVGTHCGTFHADDVLAFALIRAFVDPTARVIRSRDDDELQTCDLVIDVGGIYDPAAGRFDHHQGSYDGPRSSAGMVLDWLVAEGKISPELGTNLRHRMVDYVDDVDTGRLAPKRDVPCFARIVEAINHLADSPEAQLERFVQAAGFAELAVLGLAAGHARVSAAESAVVNAMRRAAEDRCSVVFLDAYLPWKQPYFDHGGETHPTWFVCFPSDTDSWKIVAIPPTIDQFEQKQSLPAAWAGLLGADLEAACGVPGAIFCHKNRFIAVFKTKEGAIAALRSAGLYDAPVP